VAAAAGAAWGLGLARLLALEALIPFFLTIGGTALAAALCGSASWALWWAQVRRGSGERAAGLRLAPLLLPLADLLMRDPQPWRGPVLLLGGIAVTGIAHLRHPLTEWAYVVPAAILPLAVYLPDVAPWVGQADTFEFQVVGPRLGVAHPSGYPLYVLLAKLFSLLPYGTVAWRVNLSSAVCAALAAWFLFRAVREWPASPAISLAASLTFAFSPTLWPRAVEAEVYGLNALLVTASLWVAIRWARDRLGAERALPLLALLAGAGIASHLTLGALLLLILPPALASRPRPSLRAWGTAALLFAGGLALYLYIPLRWPAINEGEVMTVAHFFRYVTNAESGGALRPLAFVQDPGRWGIVFRLLEEQVGWGGLVLALWGLAAAFRRRRPLALGTTLAFLGWVWFNTSFYVAEPDYSAFLVPAHATVALWLGVGLGWLHEAIRRRASSLLPLLLAVAALLPLGRLWLTGPTLDTAREQADEAWGRYVMELPLAASAAILADSEKFPPLYYLQQVEGLQPDLDLVMRFDEAGYRQELAARLDAGQVVYTARYLPHLEMYALRSMGPLVEVGTAPVVTANGTEAGTLFGSRISLRHHEITADRARERLWHVTLTWLALAAPEEDLEVRLRLVDGARQVAWISEATRPVSGQYPTNAWPEGGVVTDYYALALPPWLMGDEYAVQVGLFPLFGETGLAVDGGPESWLTLETLEVEPPSGPLPPLPREQRASFAGGAWLTGYDLANEAAAGGPVEVELGWHGVTGTEEVRLAWVDADGQETAVMASPLGAGARRSRHVVDAPDGAGGYVLRIELAGEQVRCNWLAGESDGCLLAEVDVSPEQEGLACFAGQVLLLEADLPVQQARPGEAVGVTLRWRALRAMEEDYTVFVQLVGPDGMLHGQVDAWPVQGTRPTSGWMPGEELRDAYEVRLDADAPVGRYRMVAGWYLLATMQRLPVLNESGQAVGNHVVLGEMAVEE
jgi:hypothetical protein